MYFSNETYFKGLDRKKILKDLLCTCDLSYKTSNIHCNYNVVQHCEIIFYFLFSPMRSFKE